MNPTVVKFSKQFEKVVKSSKPSKKVCILPFLRSLLDDESKEDIICWTNKSELEFRLVDQKKVAELWGKTKPGRKVKIMSYDNMARSLREFVKAKLLEKMEGRFCGYRFVKPLSFGINQILDNNVRSQVSSPRVTPSFSTSPGVTSSSSGSPSSIPSTSSGSPVTRFNMGQTISPIPSPSSPVFPDAVTLALIKTMTPAQLQEVWQIISQLPLIQ